MKTKQDMKTLKLYITEALHVNRNTKGNYHNYHPKTKGELIELVKKLIKERGENANLNDIDTSEITDMSFLFHLKKFNGDISEWDVSNVTDMNSMFYGSRFNGDISKWDVSNVTDMNSMFYRSRFNRDISKWNVSNVKDMCDMFMSAKFNGDISGWNVNNTKDMRNDMFYNSLLEMNPPKWY